MKVHVGILPYHLAFESSYEGQRESKVFLVQVPTKGIHLAKALPLLALEIGLRLRKAKLKATSNHLAS